MLQHLISGDEGRGIENIGPWGTRHAGVEQAASEAGHNLFNLLFFCMKNCVKLKFAQNWDPSTLVITYFNVLFDSSPDYCGFKAPGISSSCEQLRLWEEKHQFLPLVIAHKIWRIQPKCT